MPSPKRIARGEDIDVLTMVGYAMDGLVKQGKVIARSQTALTGAAIGMAVKAGAPVPDISTVNALRRTMLAVKSIARHDTRRA